VRRLALALLVLAAAVVLGVPVSAAQPPPAFRFTGYVEGVGSGPGHAFFVGDGLQLAFRDDSRAHTLYRVCWSKAGAPRRCWTRRTGRAGLTSKVFAAAPSNPGVYAARWYVNGRSVATWRFYVRLGD